MAGSKRILEDLSWAEGSLKGADIIIEDGLVVDNGFKAIVSPLGPLRKFAFSVTEQPTPFRNHLLKRGRLFLAIEHPYNSRTNPMRPMIGQVEKIDFRTFVMLYDIDHQPKPGACIEILLGYERFLIDAKKQDELDEEESRIIWV